jgi:hypothetical protein
MSQDLLQRFRAITASPDIYITVMPLIFSSMFFIKFFLAHFLLAPNFWHNSLLYFAHFHVSGPDSSVGIATRYGLDGPVIDSRWGGGEIFRTCPDRPWSPPSPLYNGYRVFPRGKAARAWRWLPTPSSAEVKERIELYLYSPSGTSWPVIGWPLPLPLQFPR